MSVGSLGGIAASMAGVPLAQTKGAEVDRAQEQGVQARQVASDQLADSAAGIGETDGENHETAERDADGHRLWERPPSHSEEESPAESPPGEARRPPDASGQSGTQLDLAG